MNAKEVILGIVLLLVFWAFQKGYLDSLGTAAWFVGAVIFVVILWLIGMSMMSEKMTADQMQLWTFATVFGLVFTFILSFLAAPLGAVFPANFTPATLTPLVLSLWLVVFGGAFAVGGRMTGRPVILLIGLIWLFSAVHLQMSTMANSYLHFGLVTGLVFIIDGLMPAMKPAK